jgi:hypothetical protein
MKEKLIGIIPVNFTIHQHERLSPNFSIAIAEAQVTAQPPAPHWLFFRFNAL